MASIYNRVATILSEKIPSEAKEWSDKFPVNKAGHSVENQLENANNYWRTKLAAIPSCDDTRNARACLANNSDSKAWIEDFTNIVIPTINNSKG